MLSSSAAVFVECRIAGVEIFRIEVILSNAESFSETLEVNNFALSQESDGILHIGIISKTENVIIGGSCLLLCCNLKRTTFFKNSSVFLSARYGFLRAACQR